MSATTTASTVDIKDSLLDAIGDTPLVRLSRIGAGLTPQLVAKVEALNPGGSIKDRVAVALMVRSVPSVRHDPRTAEDPSTNSC